MNNNIKVLIIEDEKNILTFMNKILKKHGYQTLCAENGLKGISIIEDRSPDIVLLDLGLPDMDGISLITRIRTWSNIPIIVISARNTEHDKVLALDQGADDYITKPFGTSELLARIRASLRHSTRLQTDPAHYQKPYAHDDLMLYFTKRQVILNGEEIHLTPIEYKIVTCLAQNSGKVVTYDSIISYVWGPYADDTDNKILRVNMANIRRKLEKDPAQPHYIFTEIGVGYRMADDQSQ